MNKNTCFLFLLLWIFSLTSYSQYTYQSPLDIPIVLSGNFGELRPNHFHTGLDIKTQGKQGLPIYSIEEGYISRMTKSPYGYGKVLYINHPDGNTSVYAHLQKFSTKIDSFYRAYQLKKYKNHPNFFPKKNLIKIEKGEIIGKGGNSGSSAGPHLHFEIRNTETEKPINPLQYNFKVTDKIAPTIRKIRAYPINKRNTALKDSSVYYISTKKPLTFPAYKSKSIQQVNTPLIGLAIETIDRMNFTPSTFVPYEVKLFHNGKEIFSQMLDSLDFLTNRYLNAHTDVNDLYRKKHFHKSFKIQNNQASLYKKNEKNGIIDLRNEERNVFKYVAIDYHKNKKEFEFEIIYTDNHELVKLNEQTFIPYQKDFFYANKEFSVWIPALSLYQDSYVKIKRDSISNKVIVSGFPKVLQQKMNVSLRNETVDPFLGIYNVKHGKKFIGKEREGLYIKGKSKNYGEFKILKDSIAPKILGLNISSPKVSVK